MNRTLWRCDDLTSNSANDRGPEVGRYQVADEENANLVSSRLDNDLHAPALDIDLPCELVESSTKGHFHLYIDKPMRWEQYEKLLRTLGEVGILEEGYVSASIRRRQTFLRKPGVTK